MKDFFEIWLEDNYAFNYGYALDWQKKQYISYLLYRAIQNKTGMTGFFDGLRLEPYEDSELKEIIKRREIPSKISAIIKKNIESFRNEDFILDEEDSEIIYKYDLDIGDLAVDDALEARRMKEGGIHNE